MNVTRMVLQEISHRKWNFALSLLSVTTAVACLIGTVTVLDADDIRTAETMNDLDTQNEIRIAEKEQAVQTAGKELEDSVRKIMKGLGFNVLILPADQNLNELHVDGTLTETMNEANVKKLADSKIMTINHLLPIITRKMRWEEMDRSIVLTGTRGEVPLMHRAATKKKKPLQELVEPGTMVVGYQLQTDLKLKVGQSVKLLGRDFKVTETYAERGNVDDSTVWINLSEAQELLGLQNVVHGILALECNCATEDRVAEIRAEISKVLPGTQVIERGPQALARAEARNKASEQAKASLENEQDQAETDRQLAVAARTDVTDQREAVAGMLVPLMGLACVVWMGLLAYANVKQRSAEIGILRAIGLRSTHILGMFLTKAVLIGLLGAMFGFGLGLVAGTMLSDLGLSRESINTLFSPAWLITSFILAPVMAAIASWLPAFLAATQDPAVVLQDA